MQCKMAKLIALIGSVDCVEASITDLSSAAIINLLSMWLLYVLRKRSKPPNKLIRQRCVSKAYTGHTQSWHLLVVNIIFEYETEDAFWDCHYWAWSAIMWARRQTCIYTSIWQMKHIILIMTWHAIPLVTPWFLKFHARFNASIKIWLSWIPVGVVKGRFSESGDFQTNLELVVGIVRSPAV